MVHSEEITIAEASTVTSEIALPSQIISLTPQSQPVRSIIYSSVDTIDLCYITFSHPHSNLVQIPSYVIMLQPVEPTTSTVSFQEQIGIAEETRFARPNETSFRPARPLLSVRTNGR